MPLGRRGPGLVRTAAVVGVAGRVQHRQQQKWAQESAPPAPSRTPAAPAAPDYMAELSKLAQLRDQGVITTEDFEAKKKQLLGI